MARMGFPEQSANSKFPARTAKDQMAVALPKKRKRHSRGSSIRRKGRWPFMMWTNTRKLEMIFAVAAVVAMAACGNGNVIPAPAATILEQADHFELLSLDPRPQWEPAEGDFHRYKILGTVTINDAETRKKLVTAFKRAVAENQDYVAFCFNPRHGIRVTRNKKQADFVICFQCRQVEWSGEVQGTFLISNSAQALFDSVLRSSGIRLAER